MRPGIVFYVFHESSQKFVEVAKTKNCIWYGIGDRRNRRERRGEERTVESGEGRGEERRGKKREEEREREREKEGERERERERETRRHKESTATPYTPANSRSPAPWRQILVVVV